jgi:hypothetical protein
MQQEKINHAFFYHHPQLLEFGSVFFQMLFAGIF